MVHACGLHETSADINEITIIVDVENSLTHETIFKHTRTWFSNKGQPNSVYQNYVVASTRNLFHRMLFEIPIIMVPTHRCIRFMRDECFHRVHFQMQMQFWKNTGKTWCQPTTLSKSLIQTVVWVRCFHDRLLNPHHVKHNKQRSNKSWFQQRAWFCFNQSSFILGV